MKILKFPHPMLFRPGDQVMVFGAELKVLLDNMYRTMQNHNGLGLAANQVNLEHRMLVMSSSENRPLYLVNPTITKRSAVISLFKEGCLSALKEFLVTGNRSEWVEVEYQDEKGNLHKKVFKGVASVVVQHEIDHLLGKSFMEAKTIPKAKRKELAKKWGIKVE